MKCKINGQRNIFLSFFFTFAFTCFEFAVLLNGSLLVSAKEHGFVLLGWLASYLLWEGRTWVGFEFE
jgi:hypothetical protein